MEETEYGLTDTFICGFLAIREAAKTMSWNILWLLKKLSANRYHQRLRSIT